MSPRDGLAVVLLATAVLAGGAVRAHTFEFTDVLLIVKTDGSYLVDLRVDVDALALGVSPTSDAIENVEALSTMSGARLDSAIAAAEDTLLRRVRVRFDGQPDMPSLAFPDIEDPELLAAEAPSFLGLTARFEGRVPEGAAEITVALSRAFGPSYFTALDQRTGRSTQYPVEPGARTEPFSLLELTADETTAAPPAFTRYLGLGFRHILPLGLDHVLFVLALYLPGRRWRPLLLQVTAFTLAHTLTLGLSAAGVVQLPSRPVEILIALSIAWVAIENVWLKEVHGHRLVVVFAFGLLHGLGFAGVLGELGLPPGRFFEALVGFNIGVELGQLAVIGIAAVCLGAFRNRDWYRTRVVIPGSIAIGAVGLFWTVERLIG